MTLRRIKWIDFAKGFTMLWVVVAHCINNGGFINNIILRYISYISFLFVMPIFFSISGYLYKDVKSKKDYLLLIYKKGISLLFPYFIISFMYFIYNSLVNHDYSIFNIIFAPKVDIVLWFLPSLFIMFIIVGLFDLLHIKRYILYIISLILLVVTPNFYMYSDNSLPHQSWYLIYSYLLFFCLGLIIKRHNRIFSNLFTNKMYMRICLSIFIMSFIIELIVTSSQYKNNFITISNIIPKILSVFLLFIAFQNINQATHFFKYFTKYGKYTLIIYLFHYSFETIIYNIGLLPQNIFGFLILLLITWMVSILMCHLSIRYKVLNFIFYPRKYINNLFLKYKFGRRLLNK